MDDLSKGDNLSTLILSRKETQQIIIGTDISVRVISISGQHVKFSVTAPKDVPVNREEIHLIINREQAVVN
jgi:carbon storage regulator